LIAFNLFGEESNLYFLSALNFMKVILNYCEVRIEKQINLIL